MQVADAAEVFDMLDGAALETVVERHRPDIIVPEIEAIRTERLYDFERAGIQVVPSARAVNFTMNRKAIRDLAAKEAGAAHRTVLLCPDARRAARCGRQNRLSVRRQAADVLLGQGAVGRQKPRRRGARMALRMRGFAGETYASLIVEEFIRFDSEITLLTVTQRHGPTLFCPPIGHVQQGGDYRESFQSPRITPEHLRKRSAWRRP